MSHYRGHRFKKIRRWGLLRLTSKKPGAESNLRNQSRSGKKHSQYRIRLEEK